jgi:hypothetical protein
LGLEEEHGQEHCSYATCLKPPDFESKYCSAHFHEASLNTYQELRVQPSKLAKELQQLIRQSSAKKWKSDSELDLFFNIHDAIVAGTVPESRLICLDLEFSSHSGMIFEIGACEYASGRVIMDTGVRHDCAPHELHLSRTGLISDLRLSAMSKSTSHRVYGGNTANSAAFSDVHEIASQLKEAGISPATVILVWHVGFTDLKLLRDFLESAGYHNSLPPDSNCVRLIPAFRNNLPRIPDDRLFPCRLELLFPLFYSGHSLDGLNHRVAPDAQQSRLMAVILEEYCKHPSDRDAKRLEYRPHQRKLDDWFGSQTRNPNIACSPSPISIDPSLEAV